MDEENPLFGVSTPLQNELPEFEYALHESVLQPEMLSRGTTPYAPRKRRADWALHGVVALALPSVIPCKGYALSHATPDSTPPGRHATISTDELLPYLDQCDDLVGKSLTAAANVIASDLPISGKTRLRHYQQWESGA